MIEARRQRGRHHRAPSWWWRKGGGEPVTVAQLLDRNQRLLFNYRLAQYRREHAGQPHRVVVLPRPRTAAD